MNGVIILIIAIATLLIGYVFYGNRLAKKWRMDPLKKTPAFEHGDCIDYSN